MTVELELEPELESWVSARAQLQGLSISQYLHDLLTQTLEFSPQDARQWPVGFIDATYGSLADDPVIRLPQQEAEKRLPF